VDNDIEFHFEPIDWELLRLSIQLTPGQRIQRMLDARELVVGLIRGRLRRRYPDLPAHELNLKVLEELEYAERAAR
jgi:hypothetical protein